MEVLSKVRYKTLYHGDVKKFKILKPVAIDFGNMFQKPGWSIFLFKEKRAAEQWAIHRMLSNILPKKFHHGDEIYFVFDPKRNRVVVDKIMFNDFIDVLEKHPDNKCYVYTCHVPRENVGIGNDSQLEEYTCRIDIKKFELEEITLTPENFKRYITFVTDNELQQIVDQNRTNLRGLIPSMLLINDFAYQWNNNQKLFDKMFHDNPPKPGDDLEKWMKDNQVNFKKYYPHERMKDYIKDKIKNNLNESCENVMIESSNYQINSDDCEAVIKSLNKKEFDHVGGGYWIRSDHVYYRKIEYISNEPAGFIDVYTLPKFKDAGLVVLAVNKKYRGQGLSKKLVNNAISFAKKDNKLEYLRWLADKDNIVSINLARSCGFKQSEITDNEIIFKYPL